MPGGWRDLRGLQAGLADGRIGRDERAVLFNCATGLKYPLPPVPPGSIAPSRSITPRCDAIDRAVELPDTFPMTRSGIRRRSSTFLSILSIVLAPSLLTAAPIQKGTFTTATEADWGATFELKESGKLIVTPIFSDDPDTRGQEAQTAQDRVRKLA